MTHDTDTITRLADKLMRWPLPESLCSDGCVTKCGAGRSGTNLLSVSDARELLRFLLDAAPEAAEPVAWCALSIDGKHIAYFDGKPMVMPGRMGNDCHPVPLYAGLAHTDSQAGADAVEALEREAIRMANLYCPTHIREVSGAIRALAAALSTTTGRAAE